MQKAKSNSWDNIEKFLNTDKDIEKYYRRALQECCDDNCQSVSSIFIRTIEILLDRIGSLEEDVDSEDNTIF